MRKIKTESNQMLVLEEIGRMVDFCLQKTTIDKEALAVDIWIEIWEKDLSLCWTQVRNRCIDAIRKHTQAIVVSLENVDESEWVSYHEPVTASRHEDAVETLNIVMKHACEILTPDEQEIVYLRFYSGRSIADLAWIMGGGEEAMKKRMSNILHTIKGVAEDLVEMGTIDEWT